MYSLNEGLLREAINGDNGILSVHFMESSAERELFEGSGEMWQWYKEKGFYEDFTGIYTSPAARLVQNIRPERKIMLVHTTYVSEEEIERINGHFGSNVTWVLCPRSNVYIEGSLPDVPMLRRKGCRIAVGTDSLASNTSLSLLEELKMFDADLEDILMWATANGAVALGMENSLGTFEPGKKPGAVLIENVNLHNMRLTRESVLRRLV